MKTLSLNPETRAVLAWVKQTIDCYRYDDGIDSDFLSKMHSLWRRADSNPEIFAKKWVVEEMKSGGYYHFDFFGFLNTYVCEGIKRTDWREVGLYLAKELKL